MILSFGDNETLALSPTTPKTVLIDALANIRLEFKNVQDWRSNLSIVLDYFLNYPKETCFGEQGTFALTVQGSTPIDELTPDQLEGPHVIVSQYYAHLGIAGQLAIGRTVDVSTIQWHLKNGYDPDSVQDRKPYSEVAKRLVEETKDSVAVFFRGTDFDGPLWTTLLADINLKPKYKYNALRDIRTAIDEMRDDGLFTGYLDQKGVYVVAHEKKGKPILPQKEADWYAQTLREIQIQLDSSRHGALVDAYLDMICYLTLTYLKHNGYSLFVSK